MEEVTLRFPAETSSSLQEEAEERGVAVETHIKDIVDAYRTSKSERPTVTMEYIYRCQAGTELEKLDSTEEKSEEIGSFSYGSRSVIS